MISIREARQEALRNARNRFFDALCVEAPKLVESLRACGIELEDEDSIGDLLQRARAASRNLAWLGAPLHRFESAMLVPIRTYAALSPRTPIDGGHPIMWPDAQEVFNHVQLFTDESPDPDPLTRVVLCVQHTYRAWRKAQREYRDGRPSDGVPR